MTELELVYPPAPSTGIVDELHGVRVPDPYRPLEDLDAEETRRWIEAENALTEGYLGALPVRERIRERLTELWNYEKYGLPACRGGRYFFTRNDGLQNQGVLYWMEGLDAEPRPLLDPNALSADGTVALMDYQASDDGRLLAYALSSAGSDWQEWRVRAVDDGRDLADHLQWAKFTRVAWTPDRAGFYYSRFDEPAQGDVYRAANYNQKLCFHRLGTPQADDALVYERPDHKEWHFHADLSEDGRYLVITVTRGTFVENGVFYRDLETPGGPLVELLADFDARYQFLGNDGPVFYFLTDLDAPLGRVFAVDTRRPERAAGETRVAETGDVLENAALLGDACIGLYLHDAHSRVRVFDLHGRPLREVALPGMGTVVGFDGRRGAGEAFYTYADFTTPGTVYRYDPGTGESGVFREPRVPFDPAEYVTEQVFYPSKDGTRVPLFRS